MTIDEAILEEQKKVDQVMTEDRALNVLQNGLLPQVHGVYHKALKMAIQKMQTEPAEWISESDYDTLYGKRFMCSRCHRKVIGGGTYCKWCGIKMKEGDK